MKRLALLGSLLAAGCAAGEPVDLKGNPIRPRTITLTVEVETNGAAPGAYQLTLRHDPAAARIVSIQSVEGSEFSGKPNFDPASFDSGTTRITGYSPKTTTPGGRTRLLSVIFQQVGAERSHVAVEMEHLFDVSTPPKAVSPFSVVLSRTLLDFSRRD